MGLLVVFLVLAAVAGQFSRSFDWHTYTIVGAAAAMLAAMYYFSVGA